MGDRGYLRDEVMESLCARHHNDWSIISDEDGAKVTYCPDGIEACHPYSKYVSHFDAALWYLLHRHDLLEIDLGECQDCQSEFRDVHSVYWKVLRSGEAWSHLRVLSERRQASALYYRGILERQRPSPKSSYKYRLACCHGSRRRKCTPARVYLEYSVRRHESVFNSTSHGEAQRSAEQWAARIRSRESVRVACRDLGRRMQTTWPLGVGPQPEFRIKVTWSETQPDNPQLADTLVVIGDHLQTQGDILGTVLALVLTDDKRKIIDAEELILAEMKSTWEKDIAASMLASTG